MRKEQFRARPEDFWGLMRAQGYSGYDIIEYAQTKRWQAIPDWGKQGWNLGEWPVAIVFFRNRAGCYEVAHYVEGEIKVYACPSTAIRTQIVDEIAFDHWKAMGERWVAGMESVEQAQEILGPYKGGVSSSAISWGGFLVQSAQAAARKTQPGKNEIIARIPTELGWSIAMLKETRLRLLNDGYAADFNALMPTVIEYFAMQLSPGETLKLGSWSLLHNEDNSSFTIFGPDGESYTCQDLTSTIELLLREAK